MKPNEKIYYFPAALRLTWQCCSASSNTVVLLPIRPTPMLSRTILLLRLTVTGVKWWGFTSARNLPKLSVTVTSGSGCFKTEWDRVKKKIYIYIHIYQNRWHFYQLLSLPKTTHFVFYFCNFLFYKRRTKTWALHYTFNCSLMQTSVSTHWSHCFLVDKIICYLAHKARAASSAMQYKKNC